jgi:hypothetical protein
MAMAAARFFEMEAAHSGSGSEGEEEGSSPYDAPPYNVVKYRKITQNSLSSHRAFSNVIEEEADACEKELIASAGEQAIGRHGEVTTDASDRRVFIIAFTFQNGKHVNVNPSYYQNCQLGAKKCLEGPDLLSLSGTGNAVFILCSNREDCVTGGGHMGCLGLTAEPELWFCSDRCKIEVDLFQVWMLVFGP